MNKFLGAEEKWREEEEGGREGGRKGGRGREGGREGGEKREGGRERERVYRHG